MIQHTKQDGISEARSDFMMYSFYETYINLNFQIKMILYNNR